MSFRTPLFLRAVAGLLCLGFLITPQVCAGATACAGDCCDALPPPVLPDGSCCPETPTALGTGINICCMDVENPLPEWSASSPLPRLRLFCSTLEFPKFPGKSPARTGALLRKDIFAHDSGPPLYAQSGILRC